uniref:(northern house mosquito) hypothetical protein n=1 Tax=Culex pipiens TaxID=7175 RepID=A0A8D8CJL7_CULPI
MATIGQLRSWILMEAADDHIYDCRYSPEQVRRTTMALPATLERRQLTSSFGATSGTLVQVKSKWNIRGTHPPLKRNPKLSRRKATSLQIPSVRRTTEQD